MKTKVPVFASVKLKSLTGTVRICFAPLKKGKSWSILINLFIGINANI